MNLGNQEKNILPFISTFNPNNPPVYNAIKNCAVVLKRNNVAESKRQPPNLKKLMTKAEFSNEEVGVKKWQDSRCECCESLSLSKAYTFKNVNKTFTLKTPMSWQ